MFNQRAKTTFLVFILTGFTTSIFGQDVYFVKDSPAALSFTPDVGGEKNLYVFVRGNNDELYTCFYEEPGSSWQWKSLGKPSRHHSVDSSPAAVALFSDGFRNSQIARIYVRANNGHIYECEWSGRANDNPSWRDIWDSRNGDAVYHPSATFFDTVIPVSDSSRIFGPGSVLVYTWDSDDNVSFHDGALWHSLLLPRGVDVAGDPGTFAIPGWSWAYVIGANHQLYAHVMNNRNPSIAFWRIIGAPSALGATGLYWWRRPALIHDPTRPGTLGGFLQGEGPSAFCVGGNRLWELHWQGLVAFWVEIGAPKDVKLQNSVSVVTYEHDFNKPYIFAVGDNGVLYSYALRQTNPRDWFFHNHSKDGLPPLATTFDRRPAAITHEHFVGNDSKEYLYAFAVSQANELVVSWWDKHQSKWLTTSLSR